MDARISTIAVTFKYIKIMSAGASPLPPKLGTLLLLKVCKSSREICNCNILNHSAEADAMETRDALQNPTLCAVDPDYAKYIPIGVCGYLQDSGCTTAIQ